MKSGADEFGAGSISKSDGNGISLISDSGSVIFGCAGLMVWGAGMLKAERCSGVMLVRARIYAVRSSDGNSSGRASASGVDFSSDFSCSCVLSTGGLINVGCIRDQIFFIIIGTGMLNSGFFVRTINVAVAM